MEGSSFFGGKEHKIESPTILTDSSDFDLTAVMKNMPDHLKQYAKLTKEKFKMNEVSAAVQTLSRLTGDAALRCASIPLKEN